MNQQTDHPAEQPADQPKPDHRAKVVFLIIALVIGGGIYMFAQRKPPELPEGWTEDLPAALTQATLENRRLMIVFMASPPSHTGRRMFDTTLAKRENKKALERGRFIPVRQLIKSASSQVARKYKVSHFPTTLILSPSGVERNRREDFIGEVPFRDGFLNMRIVEPPPDSQ